MQFDFVNTNYDLLAGGQQQDLLLRNCVKALNTDEKSGFFGIYTQVLTN